MKKPPVYPYGGDPLWTRVDGDRYYLDFSGQFIHRLARCFEPKVQEIREMLLELRKHFPWSQAYCAAVLGVPLTTLRRWERGERNPSGAARKLIWLLHQLYLNPEAVRNHRDVACWGIKNAGVRQGVAAPPAPASANQQTPTSGTAELPPPAPSPSA